MSSKFSLAALKLEQVTTGNANTRTTNYKPICGRVSGTRRRNRGTIMRHFIITTIIALAAAKAISQAKDKTDDQKNEKKPVGRNHFEATREGSSERSSSKYVI